MRLGLFGGSFDPPHEGHVRPVEEARRRLELERVLYLPTARPPHKEERFAPPLARFAMMELALIGAPRLQVSAHELTPETPAYTADTVGHFAGLYPEAELCLLLGSDSFARLATWRRWREIPRRAELAVLERPGWDRARVEREAAAEVWALLGSGRARWLDGVSLDLSSSALRRRLAGGDEPSPETLAPLVLDYVRKYALYR